MTERELNEKIRQAYTHAAPDVLDAVLSHCGEQKGSAVKMTKTGHSGYLQRESQAGLLYQNE